MYERSANMSEDDIQQYLRQMRAEKRVAFGGIATVHSREKFKIDQCW